MDVFDKFFKRYSYKFPKGYPDMKNEQDVLLLENILYNLLEERIVLNEASANKFAKNTLLSKNPKVFSDTATNDRIANKANISNDEFVKLIKNTFKVKNVKVTPPKQKPNPSSKFSLFSFDTSEGPANIILALPATANKGVDFEKGLTKSLQDYAGYPLDEIDNEIVKKIYKDLKINPELLSPEDIINAGETDTKRPISFNGPQSRGKQIADIVITYQNKPYYLSIKDPKGSGIYNGGTLKSIKYNKDETKVIFDEGEYNSDKFKKEVLDAFGVNPKRIVKGLNEYLNTQAGIKSGKPTNFESTNADLDKISKFLGSALDYGYYYIRKINDNDVKIYNINSAKTANQLMGTPTSVEVKYPGPTTKITAVKVNLSDSIFGLKNATLNIRNDHGGVTTPAFKVTIN